ncbi:MAG: type II toxin-antitoxin system HipA family toxin [Sulfurimonas sp.]|jgi:serine/threonine-protein kinase HipA|nr:type II toxin-antitoxin system HipA family toxin [Sulfurimonas sp.]
MSIKLVNVFLHQNNYKLSVGKLAYKERVIYFEYDKEFLKSAIELSPYKVPLKSGIHLCEDTMFEGLFGVFADSLPDGWGRLLLDRHLMSKGLKFSEITPLDRLSYIGPFGIGALSYEPVYEDIQIEAEAIVLDKLANSSLKILKGTSGEFLDTLLAIGGSSSGARPKVMVQINQEDLILHSNQTLHAGYEHYLVKFPSVTDSKDIGILEYIYSLMARDAKICMPATKLLHGKINCYFAVKRFDREGDNRIHLHSVAGLVHSDFRLPSLDYDDLLTLTLHLTKDVNEQLKMFRLACFNLFSHNRDDHAKNFSFILESNHWKLSPAYDLTFSYGPGGEHSTTYLGEGKNPTNEHLRKLAKKHSIKDGDSIIHEIKNVVDNFQQYAKSVELSNTVYKDVSSNLKVLK